MHVFTLSDADNNIGCSCWTRWYLSLVQLSHNLLKNIISGLVDGPRHTPNKFKNWHLVPTRHPQQVSSDSIFKKCADSTRLTKGSMRLYMYQSTYHWRLCHTAMIGGAENCICYSFTWLRSKLRKETPRSFVSPSTSDVTPTSTCSLFTLLVSIPCSNISQLHVLSISAQCPHVHNTLGWFEVLSIICSASSWQRRWHWQREVLCENTADDVEHATSLKITLTAFSQLVPN